MKRKGDIVFECRRCGTCCRDLLEDVDGFSSGLLLTEREAKLFEPSSVSPRIVLGRKRPRKVAAYQLNLSVCPHLDDSNRCRIYDKKPLACQSFPEELRVRSVPTISVKCPVIGNQMKAGEARWVVISATEIEAADKINRYIASQYRKHFRKGFNLWGFDLKSRRWRLYPTDRPLGSQT